MNTPTLRQLRTFVAVAERGSITEAARALNLTQPAASQQLREVERQLGTRLLDRAGRRLVPTASGLAALGPARQALAAAAEVAAVAPAVRAGKVGRVRLGTGATACIHLLPKALAAVRARLPGLEIVVATGNTPDILRRVEEGALDLGLVTMPRQMPRTLAATLVRRDALAALLPEALAASAAFTPAALAALPLILYEPGGDTRGIVDAWFRRAGLAPKPIMELGSVEAIKVLVGSGLGASVLPRMALEQPVPGAVARELRPPVERGLALVLRRAKVVDAGLRAVTAALTQAEAEAEAVAELGGVPLAAEPC
jgi:DNA-binding transcriptional LysR family regulator